MPLNKRAGRAKHDLPPVPAKPSWADVCDEEFPALPVHTKPSMRAATATDSRLDKLEQNLALLTDALPVLHNTVLREATELIKCAVTASNAQVMQAVDSVAEGAANLASATSKATDAYDSQLEAYSAKLGILTADFSNLSARLRDTDSRVNSCEALVFDFTAAVRPPPQVPEPPCLPHDAAIHEYLCGYHAPVVLTNLKAVSMNGKCGFCLDRDPGTGRYAVLILSSGESKLFKAANLTPFHCYRGPAERCARCSALIDLSAFPACECAPSDLPNNHKTSNIITDKKKNATGTTIGRARSPISTLARQ